jgi:site-specific DNA-cytosine methylase
MTRVVEVCAGVGGFSLAAEWMGWDVVGHVEIDPFCTRVLKHHWPDAVHVSDLYDCTGSEFGTVDVLCGGIPCQPWSVAGKQAGARDPRHLWPEMLRLALVLRPRWVVVENVSGFVSLALDEVWSDLEGAGYAVGATVLPACGVNAPHRRDRVWVVATHADRDGCGRNAASNGKHDAMGRSQFPNGYGEVEQVAGWDAPYRHEHSEPGLSIDGRAGCGELVPHQRQFAVDALRGRHGTADGTLPTGRDGAVDASRGDGGDAATPAASDHKPEKWLRRGAMPLALTCHGSRPAASIGWRPRRRHP